MATLNDNALVVLSQVEREIDDYTEGSNTTDDNRVIAYINALSDQFEQVTSRKWYKKTGHVEWVRGYSKRRLHLYDHTPVEAVNSVEFDNGNTTTTYDASDYRLEPGRDNVVEKINGVWNSTAEVSQEIMTHTIPGTEKTHIKVDYDGGYVTQKQVDDGTYSTKTIPADIELAAIQYVTLQWNTSGKAPDLEAISMADASITFNDNVDRDITEQLKSVIHRRMKRPLA